MAKVLIAVTSYNDVFYQDGLKTGLYFTEAYHPFEKFVEAGYEIQFVSETGTWGYDEHSIVENQLDPKDFAAFADKKSAFNVAIGQIKKASEINASDYEIFFAAGGHGTCFDYPTAKGLQSIALDIYATKSGVVAAVCHGPEIFDGLLDKTTGKPIIEGKKITGFTDEGERVLHIDKIMQLKNLKTVEQIAKELGATYVAPEGPWDDFSIVDGKIVTGVNPQSALSTATKTISAFKQ